MLLGLVDGQRCLRSILNRSFAEIKCWTVRRSRPSQSSVSAATALAAAATAAASAESWTHKHKMQYQSTAAHIGPKGMHMCVAFATIQKTSYR